jgi:VanZ family protein
MPPPRVVSAWLPVVLWAALIFSFSAVPDLGTGLGTWDFVLRKIAHVCEYAVLGLLLYRATRREQLAVLIGVLYAASDEFHQHFVAGRHATVRDVAIDTAGVLVGVLAARTIGAWNART